MIRLGGYGIPLDSGDPEIIAKAHVDFGYRAAYCPPVDLSDAAKIRAIREAFRAADVEIAEVAIWKNIVNPNMADRKKARDFACDRLALADEVGARCAVTYVGSMGDDDMQPHPDNLNQRGFDAFVQAAREILDAVKPKRAKLCFEMMQWELPDSPEILVDLIKAIDRPMFAAHLDPCNLIVTPRQYYDTGAMIRRCFELLGPWIISAHAKDLKIRGELSLHLDEVILGTGGMDYRTYLSRLDGTGIPILLEHLKFEQYPQARDYIKGVGKSLAIDI